MIAEMPEIYIAGGLTHANDNNLAIYEIISDVCSRAGFKGYLPHKDTGPRNSPLDVKEVFTKNVAAIQRSVAVIAEVSTPSFGVGMECEYALRDGLPVIVLAHQKATVSRMLLGHPALSVMISYSDEKELRERLAAGLTALKGAKENARTGLYFVVEGVDGTGKSNVLRECQNYLKAQNPAREIVLVTDPPGIAPWVEMRDELKKAERLNPIGDAILLLAARVDQAKRVIEPKLAAGAVVLADRGHDSWLVYQGQRFAERCKDISDDVREYFFNLGSAWVRSVNGLSEPDHTFLLTGEPAALLARIKKSRGEVDVKYERQEFLEAVQERYVHLFQRNSERMTLIDTTNRSVDEVFIVVRSYLQSQFGL
jgi:dTMP kinase